ncbi:hypothetical protein DAPPUDRAFT_312492 [Daphnia pulex]|uniref:Ionotropic glutamate receptor C-terminal domain-containing protein n=1 Tax=Daphnia pulex TaxID=6669 RepID=E9FZ74_DAPPU|nr:hypothetical protein DAPPUDRAFT_312492 [Daphnia pulex]|eukprot:EFX87003.1 hypothetical protein DAPPUDRAFT_312492 [Daphnia pulex]
MAQTSPFIYILVVGSIFWTIGYSSSLQATSNTLNGQHLHVIWPLWSGNPKGMPGPLKGGVILDYLAIRLNFTYEMVRVTESLFEPPENGRGLFSYLFDQQCDLLLHDVVQTYRRLKIVDMTVPWVYSSIALLMPVQDDSANVNAVIKPFQWPVWLGFVVSIVCVILALIVLQRNMASYRSSRQSRNPKDDEKDDTGSPTATVHPGKQYIYVIASLLSQGGHCASNRLSYRLVAGVWCLAAFVFVQAYTSTLFTYVVTPVNPPLVKSAYDLADKEDVNVLVRKAGIIDILVSDINNTDLLYSILRDKVNSFSQSRCSLVSDCMSLLKPGSKNILVDQPCNSLQASAYLRDAIRQDFKKTGKCNLQLARDGFSNTIISFALQKNSKYTKTVNQGMLELMQTGIIDYWDLWFRPMPLQCLDNIKSVYKPPNSKTLKMKNRPPALTLKNLTGAFIVLSLGFSLSFLAFLCEQIISISIRRSRQLQKSRSHTGNSPNQRELANVENQN